MPTPLHDQISPSMYERILGERYGRLASSVQRFHRLSGRVRLCGRVRTMAPATRVARLLAWCLGTPAAASAGEIRFELHAGPGDVFGVPCPRWLMPRIVAHERGGDDALHFDVQAVVPMAGLVVHYQGHLALDSAERV